MKQLIHRSLAILCAIGALLLASPALSSSAPGQQAAKDPGSVFPIELYRNHIYAQVRVNGSEPLSFIVDSGAGLTTLSDKRAHELNLKLTDNREVAAGAGEGKSKIALAHDVRFGLGGKDVTARKVLVLSLADLEMSEGHRVDGILGVDLFDQYVVKIDYETREVTLYDPDKFAYTGLGEAIPLKRVGGWVLAPAKIAVSPQKSIAADFIVDTGSRLAVILNSPLVAKERLLSSDREVLSTFGKGVGGEFRASLGRVQSVQLGRFVLERPIASLSQATQGATAQKDIGGMLGNEVFRRFILTFDYSRKRMILEPNPRFAEPFDENMSGLILQSTSEDLTTFKVSHVLAKSPAAEAGLQEGDVLLEFDGRPAGEFSLGSIEDAFKQENRSLALKVKRGDQLKQMTIRTKRLI